MKELAPFFVMEILDRATELERHGRDIVHLEIGEPDFPTPPAVTAAATAFLQQQQVRYTPASGLPQLRAAIAEHYENRYGVQVAPDRIIVTPGASGALLIALGLAVDHGQQFLLTDPGYPCYANLISLLGGNGVLIPVDAASRFHLDPAAVSRHWDTATAGIILASPANPTGTVIDPDILQQIIDFVVSRGGFFVADEIYHGLEYSGASPTALMFSPDVFVINSFSKYFGMTGWRVGWIVVPERYKKPAEILAQNLFIAAPAPSQYAALAALSRHCREELERRRQAFHKRRDFLVDNLLDLGFAVPVVPEGAFYVYADVAAFTSDSCAFARELLEQRGVATTPGKDFGVHRPQRFVRFAYTTDIARLSEAVERIRGFL